MSLTKLYNFFEHPKSILSKGVHSYLIICTILSAAFVFIELQYPNIAQKHISILSLLELIILISFSIEYILRFISSPDKQKFPFKLNNLIDLGAILPFLLGIENTTFLRIFRLLRLGKLFRYSRFLKAFQYQGSILQKITPMILVFGIIKLTIWYLESKNFWLHDQNLGDLFSIIGFALGIILSQKIGVAYGKYLDVEGALIRLHGTILSLQTILESVKKNSGEKICKQWIQAFLDSFKNGHSQKTFNEANVQLYKVIQKHEVAPAELAILHGDLTRDAIFCFTKKRQVTPAAYDNLLQQSTIVYVFLICIFIPGATGIVSVFMSTYMLYGMYHVTVDLDTVISGKYDLISVNTTEIESFLSKPKTI
jgi:voltage-gated potassium channel